MGGMAFEGQDFKTGASHPALFPPEPTGDADKENEVQCPRSQGFMSVSGRVYLQVCGRLFVVVLGSVLCRNGGVQNGGTSPLCPL